MNELSTIFFSQEENDDIIFKVPFDLEKDEFSFLIADGLKMGFYLLYGGIEYYTEHEQGKFQLRFPAPVKEDEVPVIYEHVKKLLKTIEIQLCYDNFIILEYFSTVGFKPAEPMTLDDYFSVKKRKKENCLVKTYFETIYPKECKELLYLLETEDGQHYGSLFEYHEGWGFARICCGRISSLNPDTYRDLLLACIKLTKNYNLDVVIGSGCIEFRQKCLYDCKPALNAKYDADKSFTKKWIDRYPFGLYERLDDIWEVVGSTVYGSRVKNGSFYRESNSSLSKFVVNPVLNTDDALMRHEDDIAEISENNRCYSALLTAKKHEMIEIKKALKEKLNIDSIIKRKGVGFYCLYLFENSFA